jgi:glucose-6-phosphate isomerase
MALKQSVENARAERIGADGVSASALADALTRSGGALADLRARHANGALALLRLPEKRDEIADIKTAAQRLVARGATDVVFLGTGGSSLGGQTLAQLAGYAVAAVGSLRLQPRVHFMDNLDPDTFDALLRMPPLATTRFVAISKSGGTAETLMQTIATLTALKKAGLETRIPELVLGLTEPAKSGKRNGLRDLLGAHRVSMLDHDTGVGGRYSVFTNVGLLAAATAGLNIERIRTGAIAALAPIVKGSPAQDMRLALRLT